MVTFVTCLSLREANIQGKKKIRRSLFATDAAPLW